MPLREIEENIQDANNELRNFYKQPNVGDSPVGPSMKATEAEVKGLRTMLDDKVQSLRDPQGQSMGIADLKREYGALRHRWNRAAARQNAVATRAKGATLWEGLAALRAAGDFATGNLLSAAKGAGTLAVGRWMGKAARPPELLTDQAFQGKEGIQASAGNRPSPRTTHCGRITPRPNTHGRRARRQRIRRAQPRRLSRQQRARRGLAYSCPKVKNLFRLAEDRNKKAHLENLPSTLIRQRGRSEKVYFSRKYENHPNRLSFPTKTGPTPHARKAESTRNHRKPSHPAAAGMAERK